MEKIISALPPGRRASESVRFADTTTRTLTPASTCTFSSLSFSLFLFSSLAHSPHLSLFFCLSFGTELGEAHLSL